jgi:hypothetical protein
MSVETQRLEFIEWILKLKDASAVREIMKKKATSDRKTAVRCTIY